MGYLEAILARRQALSAGADDALFFNLQQHATETTCANLFLIHNQRLVTPPITDGVLPGITRSRILLHAQQYQINCKEVSVTKTMIEQAEAVIVTNSLQGIREVCSLDDVVFAVDHPLIGQLRTLLSASGEAS